MDRAQNQGQRLGVRPSMKSSATSSCEFQNCCVTVQQKPFPRGGMGDEGRPSASHSQSVLKIPSRLSLLAHTHVRCSHLVPLSTVVCHPLGDISYLTVCQNISVCVSILLVRLVFIFKRKSVSFGLFQGEGLVRT